MKNSPDALDQYGLMALLIIGFLGMAAIISLIVSEKIHRKASKQRDSFIEVQLFINKVHNDETERIAGKLIYWFTKQYGNGTDSNRLKNQLQKRVNRIRNGSVLSI